MPFPAEQPIIVPKILQNKGDAMLPSASPCSSELKSTSYFFSLLKLNRSIMSPMAGRFSGT